MKKRSLLLIISMLLVFTVILYGCGDTDKENNGNIPQPKPPVKEAFFDFSLLNYNPNYTNPSSNQEKGFIIYDFIDFSLITFSVETPRAPYYIISLEGVVVGRVEKPGNSPNYTVFSPQLPGIYTIEVIAPKAGKNSLDLVDRFDIKVSAGNYPTDVEFSLLNIDNTVEENPKAGTTYKIKAIPLSNGEKIAAKGEKYSVSLKAVFLFYNAMDNNSGKNIWQNSSSETEEEITITIPNLVMDGKLKITAELKITPDDRVITQNPLLEILVSNNYAGISCMIDGTESKNISIGYNSGNLLSCISALHTFTNGESEEATLALAGSAQIGDVVPHIQYDNSSVMMPYTGELYSYNDPNFYGINGDIIRTYIQNNALYYFSPYSSKAILSFSYYFREDFNGGYYRKYMHLADSEHFLTFTKETPSSISLTSASGMEMKPNSSSSQDTFLSFIREIINNRLDAKVTVYDLNFLTYTHDKQHFTLSPIFTGNENSLDDYYYEYEWQKMSHFKTKGYFYSHQEGEVEVKIISCHDSSINYTLTVNFVNPVAKKELTFGESGRPNLFLFYLTEEVVKVKDTLYNRNTVIRDIKEDESIRILYNNVYYNNFDALINLRPNVYQNFYTLYLYEDGIRVENTSLQTGVFYIMPDYTIEVDGKDYPMSLALTYITHNSVYFDNKYEFVGCIPVLEIEVDNIQSATIKIKDSNGNEVGTDEAEVYQGTNSIYIRYHKFSNGHKNAEICKIILKEKQGF